MLSQGSFSRFHAGLLACHCSRPLALKRIEEYITVQYYTSEASHFPYHPCPRFEASKARAKAWAHKFQDELQEDDPDFKLDHEIVMFSF